MAADDGASGVAVLLEVARHLQKLNPQIGVDLVCFDAEDYGAPYWAPENKRDDESTFCLGSSILEQKHRLRLQTALRHPPRHGGRCRQSLLLRGFLAPLRPTRRDEGVGCRAIGRCRRLLRAGSGGFITDDHLPMNNIAGIPTIDIIAFNPDGGFPEHWHTTGDTMDKLSAKTLRAVADAPASALRRAHP